jgi:hypothetical protein
MSRLNANGSSITDLVGALPFQHINGDEPALFFFPELGVETFMAGEMVCLSGSAGNAVGLTKPGTDASGTGILGFAADNASGYTSSFKGVYLASHETVFFANVGYTGTSALAQTAASDLGQLYGLTSLSGRTYVDKLKTNSSTAMCRVIGFHDQDIVPSFYGRVKFTVLGNSTQWYSSMRTSVSGTTAFIV